MPSIRYSRTKRVVIGSRTNLTVIRSLLSLQAHAHDDLGCAAVLEQAASRVQSMITLYETLFRLDASNELSLKE